VASTETADVVIIGGGVIGAGIAYFLAQRKLGRIILLEREVLGSGSTGRSVASIDLFSFQPAAIKLQAHAYEIFSHFEEITGGECGLATTGFAVLGGPGHTAALPQAVAVAQAAGIDVQSLTPEEFAILEPAASIEGLASICYVPAGGYGDPILTTNAFASAARRSGVVIQQGRPVTGLLHQGGRVTGVETTSGPIAASVVVCAAGPWSRRLFQTFGLDNLGLYAVQHAVIMMQRPENFGPAHLSILDLPNNIYARPETGGLTLAGSIDPVVGYDPVEPEDDLGVVTSDYTLWTVERLVQRYPVLEAGRLRQGWSGLMTISPDWQPVLGPLSELSGLYCATGFSGQGFKISPAVGDLMAGLIAGEAQAAQLLAPFRPARFAEGQPLAISDFAVI
jgi:glycine/D-amino acid oxidase-like deaminating enzyme